jgi:multidrug resistance efflux pump
MDDKQLLWRESELLASRDRALRQRDLAMTDSTASVASAQMAQLEAAGYDTELALLEFKRENLTLRAPISGMVLTGDLERVEGVPVSQGDRLFEVGPMDEVVVELSIPASDVNLVEPGAALELRLASFPERSWAGKLTQIDPQSTVANGGNFFKGEAELSSVESDQQLLRAGMKGRANLRGETVPRVWTFTRRLWDYLHLKFFW